MDRGTRRASGIKFSAYSELSLISIARAAPSGRNGRQHSESFFSQHIAKTMLSDNTLSAFHYLFMHTTRLCKNYRCAANTQETKECSCIISREYAYRRRVSSLCGAVPRQYTMPRAPAAENERTVSAAIPRFLFPWRQTY